MTDARYNPHSRLARKEEIRSLRRIVLFSLATILLLVGLFSLGIPALIGISSFLASLRSTNEPITTTDTTPPFPPRLEPLQEATNSSKITIPGTGESSATIELFVNGVSSGKTVVDKNGVFEFSEIALEEGTNTFSAAATDQAGNTSQMSIHRTIAFVKNPPKIELTDPPDGVKITGEEKTVRVSGKTESVVALTINDRVVILNNDGSFSFQISLSDGENRIKVEGVDIAGNKTSVERTVTYSP